MIRSIRFCIGHASRIRKVGITNARLRFEAGYNVLIGPDGSGTSTVLKAIATCAACEVDRTDDDQVKYVTTETLHPLVGGALASCAWSCFEEEALCTNGGLFDAWI